MGTQTQSDERVRARERMDVGNRVRTGTDYGPTGCREAVGAREAHSQRGEGARVYLVGQPAACSGDQAVTHERGSGGGRGRSTLGRRQSSGTCGRLPGHNQIRPQGG